MNPMTDKELIANVRREIKRFDESSFIAITPVLEWLPTLCDRLEAANREREYFKDSLLNTRERIEHGIASINFALNIR